MKKNIYTIFDDMTENFDEVDFAQNTDVDTQLIKNNIFSELGFSKKKKPFGKTFKLTVIAATLAAALAVGSTAINANGGIERIREFFSGTIHSSDLYDGGNVEVTTSDPDLNVELLAVTGDSNMFYAVIQAEKKDGTVFTDEDYIYDSHIGSPDISVSCKSQSGRIYHDFNNCTLKKYHLSADRKTLKIFLSTDLSNAAFKGYPDIQNGIVTVSCGSLKFHKIKEVIAVYDELIADNYFEFLEVVKQKNITDTWTWIETPENVKFCTIDTKEYDIPFEMTFSMKHSTNNHIQTSISNETAPHFILNTTHDVKMEISPFNIRISGDGRRLHDMDSESQEPIWYLPDQCFERVSPYNSKIILNNGQEYYFEVIPHTMNELDNEDKSVHVELELNYSTIPMPTYTVDKVVIDTRQIKQIIINGDTIYTGK